MWRKSPADEWLIQVKPVFEKQEATILTSWTWALWQSSGIDARVVRFA